MSLAVSELDPSSQELAARGPEVEQVGELRQNAIGSHAASTFLITALLWAFLHPTFTLSTHMQEVLNFNMIYVISLF